MKKIGIKPFPENDAVQNLNQDPFDEFVRVTTLELEKDKIQAEKEAFAIRFAEWVIKEKWIWSYFREGWMQHHLPGEVKTKTTSELMEEFKKPKIKLTMMPLSIKPGAKVMGMFDEDGHIMNGRDAEQELAERFIKEGVEYTVDRVDIGSWTSAISLKEFPGKLFNTVHFGIKQ